MSTLTNKEEKPQEKITNCGRCRDFDIDCIKVKDKLSCYMGTKFTEVATGYCPFLNQLN